MQIEMQVKFRGPQDTSRASQRNMAALSLKKAEVDGDLFRNI